MTDHSSDATSRTDADAGTRCGAGDEQRTADGPTADRWSPGPPVLDAKLPRDVQVGLGRVLGEEPVETLNEWAAEVRRRTGGGSFAVDDLCHADGGTGHRGEMAGETYHFLCVYDAVILSALADRPVDIRTESPDGTVVEARAAGTDELTVTPESAVVSFGVDADVAPPAAGDPSLSDLYAAMYPYVRAFPDRATYDRWAETVPAATVAIPLAGATDLAAALVE